MKALIKTDTIPQATKYITIYDNNYIDDRRWQEDELEYADLRNYTCVRLYWRVVCILDLVSFSYAIGQ